MINLAADKHAVFREMARVLKPGGRLAISDIALKKPIPPEVGQEVLAYVGCVAGAIPIEEYKQGLIDAGFSAVEIIDTKADLNVYSKIEGQSVCCPPRADDQGGCCGPAGGGDLAVLSQSTPDFHRPAGRAAPEIRRQRLRRQRQSFRRQTPVNLDFDCTG